MFKRYRCALVLVAICNSIASAQIGLIKTNAGNNSGSFPGNGGPAAGASSANLTQSVKSSASLTAAVIPTPAVAGQTITLTANLNQAATGTVTFTDGTTRLGTIGVSSGPATYTTSSLTPGSHSLGFSYSGDSNYLPASANFAETVLAATSVTLSSSANPSPVGQSVTLTASVKPSTATGTVQFLTESTVIGTETPRPTT